MANPAGGDPVGYGSDPFNIEEHFGSPFDEHSSMSRLLPKGAINPPKNISKKISLFVDNKELFKGTVDVDTLEGLKIEFKGKNEIHFPELDVIVTAAADKALGCAIHSNSFTETRVEVTTLSMPAYGPVEKQV